MKTLSVGLACALALTSFGCATDRDGDGDGTGSGSGTGSGEPPPPPPPRTLDLTGTYRVYSQFDIAENMPGAAGSILNGLLDATDDPTDPAKWLLEQLIAQADPQYQSALNLFLPFVADELNQQLTSWAPGLVNGINDLGDTLDAVTRKFGLTERFEITTGPAIEGIGSVAKITVDGVRFTLDGTTSDYLFASYDLDNVITTGVGVSLQNTQVQVAQHQLPIKYGALLRIALDEVVIPAIDPDANNLGELFNEWVNCANVGVIVSDAVGVGSAGLWQGFCVAGLNALAEPIYDQITGIDGDLVFEIAGPARAVDTNADYKVDRFEVGTWTGMTSYNDTDGALGPSTWNGTRLELP